MDTSRKPWNLESSIEHPVSSIEHRIMNKWLILPALALVLGVFWFFGRTQRIVVVESKLQKATIALCAACEGRGQAPCLSCGGDGYTSRTAPCAACQGTGQGQFALGLKQTKGSVRTLGAPPRCAACRGTGKAPVRTPCPACGGKGSSVCSDCGGSGRVRKAPVTVRAEASLWEEFLALFGVTPDPNAAPQRWRRDGAVPLVRKYAELKVPAGTTVRIMRWAPVRREGDRWRVKVQVQTVRPNGAPLVQAYDFEIFNREVVSSRGVPW